MFQSLTVSDSASSSLVPQTGSRIYGQQPQIVEVVQKQANIEFPRLKEGGDMMKESCEFQRKLAFLSKASLQLSRKCLHLSEKAAVQEQQITLLRDQYRAERALSQSLRQQRDKLQLDLTSRQFQLRNKESLSQAATFQRDDDCRSDYEQIVETQKRQLQSLIQEKQQLLLINQQQKVQIEKLNSRITEMKIEVDSRQQVFPKVKLNQDQLSQTRLRLKSAYESLSNAVTQLQLIKNQKNQLQTELDELKRLSKSVQQMQLASLEAEEELMGLREECRLKSQQLKKVEAMYRELQQTFYKVREQRDFMNDHYNNLTQDKSEVEHILIDKFVLALVIMKSKLQSAEVDNLMQCMDLQKKAIFCRLEMEYKKMMR